MSNTKKPVVEPEATTVDVVELNLDKKVTVRSIAPWTTGFERITDGTGDVSIPPNGQTRLSRNEIISQIQRGNVLFCGTDGVGSHATLVIEDEPTRKEVDFDTDDSQQLVLTSALISKLFKIAKQADFEKEFKSAIVTRAEKFSVMSEIKKLNINDYRKIRFAEIHTGLKLENI